MEIVSDIEYAIESILEEVENQQKQHPELTELPRNDFPATFEQIRQEVDTRTESFNHDKSYPIQPEKTSDRCKKCSRGKRYRTI